jgi:hypothetical protein
MLCCGEKVRCGSSQLGFSIGCAALNNQQVTARVNPPLRDGIDVLCGHYLKLNYLKCTVSGRERDRLRLGLRSLAVANQPHLKMARII